MAKSENWTHEQRLVAFRVYCRMPFGQLDARNAEIIRIAELIGRTPSALGMKACNFASLDPAQQARGVRGLTGASQADRELWQAFQENAEAVAAEAEEAYERFTNEPAPPLEAELVAPSGPTETERLVRVRRVQSFFRQAVLVSYEHRCALTGLAVPELLNASHIVPWNVDERRRADPRNGICLNVLHDRAFDRGLLTFDEGLRTVLSPRLLVDRPPPFHVRLLLDCEGVRLEIPTRFHPEPACLEFHRSAVFRSN